MTRCSLLQTDWIPARASLGWNDGSVSLCALFPRKRESRLLSRLRTGVRGPAHILQTCRVPLPLRVWRFAALIWLSVVLGVSSVSAHTTGISYADVEIGERVVKVRLQLNVRELQFAAQLDQNHDLQITPEEVELGFKRFAPDLFKHYRFGTDLEEGQGFLSDVSVRPQAGEVECRLSYVFRQPVDDLWIKATLHDLTDSGHWHLAQVRYDGQEEQRTFNLENPEARIELWRGWSSYSKVAWRFLSLAWRNLVSSPELAGFLAGLVLVRNAADGGVTAPVMFLLSQLIAFVVGHRIGSVLPPGFAGAAMALSVVYVAAENLLLEEITHRGWIAALFGVIYGLAFADVVQTAGLPLKGTLLALSCFQVGTALLVAGLVALTLFLAAGLKRLSQPRHAIVLTSLAFMALGLFQFVRKLS